MSEKNWNTCRRCGAVVELWARHREWHEKLEGTSEPDPGKPGSGRVIAFD